MMLLASVSVGAHPIVGIFRIFLQAGPVSKIIFLILLLFSVASWALMISKALQLRRVQRHDQAFLRIFRQSSRFSEINAAGGEHVASPLVALFRAGYLEIDTQVKAAASSGQEGYRLKSLESVERTLRRAINTEYLALSQRSQFLATTANATPFIGLFGTVWGIMVAFQDIGATGSASIVAVAPGIAEALVNTAAGLGAAIPALIGYNQLVQRLRSRRALMDDFALEFLNLAERNFT